MRSKLLKKLRRQFSKRFTVATVYWKDGDGYRIYDEGIYLFTSWNREDLHLRLRELYFHFLEEYVAERRKGRTRLTYWW